jgi:5-methylcytosine-specific restriction endonuclease McrA
MISKPKTLKPYWVNQGGIRYKKKEDRYHTARWRKISQQVRREEPFCKYCEARGETQLSEVADHIIPVQQYEEQGGDFYDRNNLCGCCKKCNLRKKRYQAK